MTPLRCYNCGLIGHKTQFCPSFGPRYPGPGKTATDYTEEAAKISQLFAADILAEHSHEEVNEGPVLEPPKRRGPLPSIMEENFRIYECSYCKAEKGDPCRSRSGQVCRAHGVRKDLYYAEAPIA
jgi:hypothetical protein